MTELKSELLMFKLKRPLIMSQTKKNLTRIEVNVRNVSKTTPLFEVSGKFPAFVCKLNEECSKRNINVQVGDYIYEINKRNVSRASSKSVRKIIKSASDLKLVLYRPDQIPTSKLIGKTAQLQKKSLLSKYIKLIKSDQLDFKSLISCLKPSEKQSFKTTSDSDFYNITEHYNKGVIESNIELVMCANSDKTHSMQLTKIVQKTSESVANFEQKLDDDTIDYGYESIPTSIRSEKTSCSSLSSLFSISTNANAAITSDFIQLTNDIKNEMSTFLADIQTGVEIYVRPSVIFNIISKEECLKLYQNVEKLIPVTKFMLNIFNSTDLVSQLPNTDSLKIVFASFKTYLNGLPNAVELLEYLSCHNTSFIVFLEKINDLNSLQIFDFIFRPFNFICKMIDNMRKIEQYQHLNESESIEKHNLMIDDLFEFSIKTQQKLECRFESENEETAVQVQIKDTDTIRTWKDCIVRLKEKKLFIELAENSHLNFDLKSFKNIKASQNCSMLQLVMSNQISNDYCLFINFDTENKRDSFLSCIFN